MISYKQSRYFVPSQGYQGEWIIYFECDQCGALVTDCSKHTDFHDFVNPPKPSPIVAFKCPNHGGPVPTTSTSTGLRCATLLYSGLPCGCLVEAITKEAK